jgi:hypothetical protein
MEYYMNGEHDSKSEGMLSRSFQNMDSFCLIAMGMLFFVGGLQLDFAYIDLGFRPETIGPGAYMAGIGFLLLFLSAVEGYTRIKNSVEKKEKLPVATLKGFFLLALSVSLMPLFGFTISVALLIVLFMTWVTRQRLLKSILFSIILTAGYYVIFVKVAGIVLPRGIIGF